MTRALQHTKSGVEACDAVRETDVKVPDGDSFVGADGRTSATSTSRRPGSTSSSSWRRRRAHTQARPIKAARALPSYIDRLTWPGLALAGSAARGRADGSVHGTNISDAWTEFCDARGTYESVGLRAVPARGASIFWTLGAGASYIVNITASSGPGAD